VFSTIARTVEELNVNMFSCAGQRKSHGDIVSSKIDKELKREKKKYRAIHRLLLLGL